MEWYPLGRLLSWIALAAALITTLGAVTLGGGNHESYTDLMRRAFDAFARVQAPPGSTGPAGPEIIGAIVGLLPLFVASSFVMLLTLNLWLAGRIVAVSQRLPRPWPPVSSTQLPRSALGGAALALACSFLPGYGAVFGLALLGSLFIAFAFQGLAVLHEITLGRPNRTGLLVALYALLVFLSQLVLPVVALFGMADSAFGLRARLLGGGPSAPHQP
jgi:hypothetical protein